MTNIIPCQVSKIFKVQSSLMVDGLGIINDKRLYIRDHENKKFLFDYFFVYDENHKKICLDNGVSNRNIFKISFPSFIEFSKKNVKKQKIYDCVILNYDLNNLNVFTKDSQKYLIICKILNILNKLEFKKIFV